jgi:hypothetical protein
MPSPGLDPDCLCVQIEPGRTRIATSTIVRIPSSAEMTATVVDGDSLVRVKQVTIVRILKRPPTDKEIAELPPFPLSIREKARNRLIEVREEVQRVTGDTLIAVKAGQLAEIQLEFSVPPESPEGVTCARLLVEGTSWTSLQLPVFCVVGRSVAVANVEPASIRLALAPGERAAKRMVVENAPTNDALIACVVNGADVIRLEQMIAFQPIRRRFTEEELLEMPPIPPSIREIARREGYVEYQEIARSTGATPLPVDAGQMIQLYLEFSAPAQDFRDITEALLVIDSPHWERMEVPLRQIIGQISVALSTETVTLHQGATANLTVSVTSLAAAHLATTWVT